MPSSHAADDDDATRARALGRRYEEMLAQGLMDMSDIFCKCGKQVGYMFRADKTPNRRNLNQVGRMGLVCSTFAVAPYQLSHAKVYASA